MFSVKDAEDKPSFQWAGGRNHSLTFPPPLENRLPSFGSWKEHLAEKLFWLFRPREAGERLSASPPGSAIMFGISGLCREPNTYLRGCALCRTVCFLSARKKLGPFSICSSSPGLQRKRLLPRPNPSAAGVHSSQLRERIQGRHTASVESRPSGLQSPARVSISLMRSVTPKAALATPRNAAVPLFLKQTSSFWIMPWLTLQRLINQIWKISHPQLAPRADTVGVISFSMPVYVF